jgi:glycosyltransferase involved in cell wall biosynthesis
LQNYLQLESVRFENFSSDIEKIWSRHHALVLPSRFEGMPLVVLEAMLCGRACLVTDIAGNAEFLEDDVSGFIAAAPKIDFVDEALERLWQSWQNGELQNIGKNAAEAVRAKIPREPALNFAAKIEALL